MTTIRGTDDVVASAPRLTDEQIAVLRRLLRPVRRVEHHDDKAARTTMHGPPERTGPDPDGSGPDEYATQRTALHGSSEVSGPPGPLEAEGGIDR